MPRWQERDVPSQAGRVAVVTGATGGLGFETARVLAAAGGRVILAGRNPKKGELALARLRRAVPAAQVEFGLLDLSNLASVRAFAEAACASHPAIDLLVNNAGVMAIPTRHVTSDGFEQQFGTNYLGHFALTGRLLPALRRGQRPRVVNLASLAHLRGRIDFGDPQGHRYGAWKAYSQSKLAMLMFGIEFQRRSAALGWGVMGVSAHPGWAMTDIFTNGPRIGGSSGLKERFGMMLVSGFRPIRRRRRAADPVCRHGPGRSDRRILRSRRVLRAERLAETGTHRAASSRRRCRRAALDALGGVDGCGSRARVTSCFAPSPPRMNERNLTTTASRITVRVVQNSSAGDL